MTKPFVSYLIATALALSTSQAQEDGAGRHLGLEDCRRLAMEQNKDLAISRQAIEAASNKRKAARTAYFPEIVATGGYVRSQYETALLSQANKQRISSLGTTLAGQVATNPVLQQALEAIVAQQPGMAPLVQTLFPQMMGQLSSQLDATGQQIVDALRTDTRNMYMGAITLTQPLYVGGKIRAYNQIARYAEGISQEQYRLQEQEVLLAVDEAYWQVVSLVNKLRLAQSYRELLSRLSRDVSLMIEQGVATKADALSVEVKLNEAELMYSKVESGLRLARMLLCQVVGLPLESHLTLADETLSALDSYQYQLAVADTTAGSYDLRPELRSLSMMNQIAREQVRLVRSEYLPSIALEGKYTMTNPNRFDGFENKFRGQWSVGLMLKVPLWSWGQGSYKIRAARAEARQQELKLANARERIALQVKQSEAAMRIAERQLLMATSSLDKANENLRYATRSFAEGLTSMTQVMEAQTAWLSAHSAQLDAQIEVRLSRLYLLKAEGRLGVGH